MKTNHKEEVELLKKESELPLEDLLAELPPNYLEDRDKSLSPLPKDVVEDEVFCYFRKSFVHTNFVVACMLIID